MSGAYRTTVKGAFLKWEQKTDLIDFQEWTGSGVPSETYLYVDLVSAGCSANLGYNSRSTYRRMELSSDVNCLANVWAIVHEAGHVIGFPHEAQRSDRDEWVTFYQDNLEVESLWTEYRPLTSSSYALTDEPDCVSVMMYPGCMGSHDEASCMATDGLHADYAPLVPVDPVACNLSQGTTTPERISSGDVDTIELMYGTTTTPPPCTGCGC